MKLADLQPKDYEYEISHPATGDSLDVKVQLTDPTSPVVVAAQRDFLTALRATAKADLPSEAEILERALIARAKAAVAGWDEKFNEFFGGPFSKELVEAIFAEPKFRWLVDQLAGAANDRGNFFR
jgi:hypothetical protein